MPGGRKKPEPEPETESDEEFEEEEGEEEEVEEFDAVAYFKSIPLERRRRVYALKAMLAEGKKFERQMRDRLAALMVQTEAKLKPLLEARAKIVAGEVEPTNDEVARGEATAAAKATSDAAAGKVEEIPSSDDEKGREKKGVKVVAPKDADDEDVLKAAGADPKGGIPNFWLTAMRNNEVLDVCVMGRDEAALKFLKDIRCESIDGNPQKGFKLTFAFAENPYFTDKELVKCYHMDQEDEDDDDVLDHATGCSINWKSAENKLTCVLKKRKQRKKGSAEVRIVTKEEKCPSFFHFFEPPQPPKDDEEDEDDEDMGDIENDYEQGLAFKNALVPRAVYYYTGQAIADMAEGMEDDDDFEAEGDDEEGSDEDDE